ncbi:MAG: hypothetical protein E2604_12480, partial [Flavobacterium sp.]|nr:hypothetical protein [Flavobacterium sp.]
MKRLLILMTLLLSLAGYSQESRTITGKVIDAQDKLPMPGVSIYVENKSIATKTGQSGIIESTGVGTVTDMDGNFKLEITKDVKSLRVSFIGYESYLIDL